ncbi:MAG: trypsin-like peptidase domain-containing protein [Planctomycetes bacterium]|nr:trypsin-like peptidase domain-containing protein [Planctomycetota bacterium]
MRSALLLVAICVGTVGAAVQQPPPVDFAQVQESVGRSVVCVHARTVARGKTWRSGVGAGDEEAVGSGSGFVVRSSDRDAHIVTNAHVVLKELRGGNAGPVRVFEHLLISFPSGDFYDAEVVGFSVDADLAVLVAQVPNVPAVKWADSNSARVGEWVMSVGYPRGLGYSASVGIVSATERSFGVYSGHQGVESFVQTDASINPGNSGGPLVNTRAEVLGVNAAIITQSGGSEGLGFAISSNLAKRVIDDILECGQVRWAGLGLDVIELSPENARDCGLPFAPVLRVVRVAANGAADTAGLAPGSFLTGINEFRLLNLMQLRSRLAERRVNESVRLSVVDEGKSRSVQTTLAPLAGAKEQLHVDDMIVLPEVNLGVYWAGKHGVVVSDVLAGRGADWGVLPGDVVLVPDARGTSSDIIQLRRLLNGVQEPQLTIKRNGRILTLPERKAQPPPQAPPIQPPVRR